MFTLTKVLCIRMKERNHLESSPLGSRGYWCSPCKLDWYTLLFNRPHECGLCKWSSTDACITEINSPKKLFLPILTPDYRDTFPFLRLWWLRLAFTSQLSHDHSRKHYQFVCVYVCVCVHCWPRSSVFMGLPLEQSQLRIVSRQLLMKLFRSKRQSRSLEP